MVTYMDILGSVSHMVDAGNTFIFKKGCSQIVNEVTKPVIPVREVKGGIEIDMWVPAAKESS